MSTKISTRIIWGLALATLSLKGYSQTTLINVDFSTGIPADWSVFDEDGLTPAEPVSIFTEAWISWIDDVDTAAASTSYYDLSGAAEDYLVTPRISLANFSRLIWTAKSGDASYPDGYQILISTTDSLPASFTDTLWHTTAAAPYYETKSVDLDELGYSDQEVFIAIRNTTNDGYTLLLDRLKVYGAETASIRKKDTGTILSIYPNPTNNVLNIRTNAYIQQVQLFNTSGKLVLTTTSNTLNINAIPSGIYQIIITTDEGVIRRKVVKS